MKKRYYKEIDTETFDFIFENSPVEIIDKTASYDIESFEYFLTLRFRNVSDRKISALDIRLDLYDGISATPYKKIEYTYKVTAKNTPEDIIGGFDRISIPQTYYKKLIINILGVTFADGEHLALKLTSETKPKLISQQANHIVTACELVDDKESVKDKYPAIIMPEFGKTAWICCCSQKNKAESETCERCGRERDKLKSVYSHENLVKTAYAEAHGTSTMTARRIKGEFMEKHNPTAPDNIKEILIEHEIKKVDKREKYKEKMRIQAIPRFILYFVLAYLLYFVLNWIFGLVPEL
ncbi:MAG: hypothetical protein E7613_06490 [Ruminococcaceae bacterium]|nr:hypothetical protein [Oscillospiraceae bacterium]